MSIYQGFIESFEPMGQAKAKAALERLIGNSREFGQREYLTRRELVERRMRLGWKVGTAEGGRALVGPDGTYLRERDISKTALDYAEFMTAWGVDAES